MMRGALLFLALAPVWAQTQIVTGGTAKVTGGTSIVTQGTSVVSGGTTVIGGGGGAPTYTIGHNTVGASSQDALGSFNATSFTAPAHTGNAVTISLYCQSTAAGPVSVPVGVYGDIGTGGVGTAPLLASAVISCTTTAGWRNSPLTWSVTGGTVYWLALASSSDHVQVWYDSGGTTNYAAFTYTGSMPNPAPAISLAAITNSIYVSYQ